MSIATVVSEKLTLRKDRSMEIESLPSVKVMISPLRSRVLGVIKALKKL